MPGSRRLDRRHLARAAAGEWNQRGPVFIKNYVAAGGVELPFGGTKRSGHGREKGFEVLYGVAALKTIAIKHALS